MHHLPNGSCVFFEIMHQCIPKLKLFKRKSLPWLSKQLIQMIRKKRLLFAKAKRSGRDTDYHKYSIHHNKLSYMLRLAKRRVFRKLRGKKVEDSKTLK